MAYALSDARVKHELGRDITRNVIKDSIFKQFIGTGDNAIIQAKKADGLSGTVTMKMRGMIRNGGITGDQLFEANRASLTYLTQTVGLELVGNSIESDKNLTIINQVQFEDFKADSKDGLSESEADKFDRMIMSRATAGLTNIVFAGNREATTPATMEATDILSVADVVEAKRRAEEGVTASGAAAPKLRPFKTIVSKDTHGVEIKRNIFVMFVGSASAYNLKQDPLWNTKQEAAKDIGLSSPIFTGQLGVIDDVVLVNAGTISSEYAGVYTSGTHAVPEGDGTQTMDFTGYAGGATGAIKTEINLLMGASAMLLPMDSGYVWGEEPFNVNTRVRIAVYRYLGLAKTKFIGKAGTAEVNSIYHNKDYGVIGVVASATRA